LVDIKEVADNIYMFDNQLYSITEWGSVYILNEEKKALVETGPTTSAGVVLDGIRSCGIEPEDIAYIIVTHIHLDHAGGAGTLLRDMPNARVVVHRRGARHLVNPERLVKSVIQAQGEEGMARSGEVVPAGSERMLAVEDGNTIRLGDKQVLNFIDAPGHAPHELCIYESRNRGLFTGDAVAVSLAGGEVFLPFHPPPNFDFEQNKGTIKKLMGLKAEAIYYSHFGVSRRVQEDLQANLDKIQAWHDIVMAAIEEGAFEEVAERLAAHTRPELEPLKRNPPLYEYMINDHLPLIVAGHIGYYRQRYLAG
jgi:glyoxylase-like metal-dependent hydrolase (beta-lactamase superfamily II)